MTEYVIVYAVVGIVLHVVVMAFSVALGMLWYDRMKGRREAGPRRFYE